MQLQKWRNGGHFELKIKKLICLRNENWFWDLVLTQMFMVRFQSNNVIKVIISVDKWINGGHFKI